MFKFDADLAQWAWDNMTNADRAAWVRNMQANLNSRPDEEIEKIEAFFADKIVHTA